MSDDYHLENTMRKIIGDRIAPRIVHQPFLQAEIKKGLKPDYVAGLRPDRFNKYMENPRVKAQLQIQPTGENDIIFPFMVTEAKKEDGDSWDYVYFQTVFPIYTMLSVQWSLLSANAANGHALEFEPIVWFYAYRGQHWELHLAYLDMHARNVQILEDEVATPDDRRVSKQIPYPIKIVRVWEGDVTDENKALQLLLIVDHMADWARDYYREMIKKGLQNLFGFPGLELFPSQDTDIHSKFGEPEIGEDEIQRSENDMVSVNIPGHPSTGVAFEHEPTLPSSSLLDAFPYSEMVQTPQQPQFQQVTSDVPLSLGMPYQGTSQHLPEPQTPTHYAPLVLSNLFLSTGIPQPGPSQVIAKPLLPPYSIDLSYQHAILPRIPQLVHQPQPPAPIGRLSQAGGNSFLEIPQIAQQPQPSYVGDKVMSAGNQYFRVSQASQSPQPQTYPTTRLHLDNQVHRRQHWAPSPGSRGEELKRTRSESPRKRNAARDNRGGSRFQDS